MEFKTEKLCRVEYPKILGYYVINKELKVAFTRKPSRFYRMMTKILLGWVWRDEKQGEI
jgi:hypothetical protein